MPSDQPNVETPRHPTAQMTTSELSEYRRQLEGAIAFFGKQTPIPPARRRLQARLDEVVAEQADRARIFEANGRA
jgi:hypothetical protein